eukprot:3169266-Pleurochrysis_carterae.AAC.1
MHPRAAQPSPFHLSKPDCGGSVLKARARTRLLPCVPTPLESVSGNPDPLPFPPNGAFLSSAMDGEAARP